MVLVPRNVQRRVPGLQGLTKRKDSTRFTFHTAFDDPSTTEASPPRNRDEADHRSSTRAVTDTLDPEPTRVRDAARRRRACQRISGQPKLFEAFLLSARTCGSTSS